MAPAVHAASAAVCAACRLNHKLLMSMANAIAPIKKSPSPNRTKSITCPDSGRPVALLLKVFVFIAIYPSLKSSEFSIHNPPVGGGVQSDCRPPQTKKWGVDMTHRYPYQTPGRTTLSAKRRIISVGAVAACRRTICAVRVVTNRHIAGRDALQRKPREIRDRGLYVRTGRIRARECGTHCGISRSAAIGRSQASPVHDRVAHALFGAVCESVVGVHQYHGLEHAHE